MNKIQQYRKVSAKKIGLKLEDHELLGKVYRNYKTQFIVPIDAWQPDTNADLLPIAFMKAFLAYVESIK